MCRVSAMTYVVQIHVRKRGRGPTGCAHQDRKRKPRIRQLALQRLSLFALNPLEHGLFRSAVECGLSATLSLVQGSHRVPHARPRQPTFLLCRGEEEIGGRYRGITHLPNFLCSQGMFPWWALPRIHAGICQHHAMHICVRRLADVSALPPLPSNALRQAFNS